MTAFVFLTIFFGSLLLPPIVETIFQRLGRRWAGSLLGSFSIFLLWPLIYLLGKPDPVTDPIGENQAMGGLFVLGVSFYVATSYWIYSLGFHAAIDRASRRRPAGKPWVKASARPWISLGLIGLATILLVILAFSKIVPAALVEGFLWPLFVIPMMDSNYVKFSYVMVSGIGLFLYVLLIVVTNMLLERTPEGVESD